MVLGLDCQPILLTPNPTAPLVTSTTLNPLLLSSQTFSTRRLRFPRAMKPVSPSTMDEEPTLITTVEEGAGEGEGEGADISQLQSVRERGGGKE